MNKQFHELGYVAVLLCRVSSAEQAEGYSLDGQEDRLVAFCKHNNIQIDRVFKFYESSTRGVRKKFLTMLDYIKAMKQPVLLVTDKVDRLQRSFKHANIIENLIVNGKLAIHYVTENLTIDQDTSSKERLMHNVLISFAQDYADTISENVKRSQVRMRKEGLALSHVPIGYLRYRDKENKTHVVVDENTAPIVIKIFEMYATGLYTYEMLRKFAEESGLITRRAKKPLVKSDIENMIKNKFYCGYIVPHDKKTPEYEHIYPRLISYDLYQQCKDVRKGRQKTYNKTTKKEYIFNKLIRCVKCGCCLSAYTKKEKYVYLRPNNKKKCDCKQINEMEAEKMVTDVLGTLSMSEDVLKEYIDRVQKRYNKEHNVELTQHKLLESNYSTIDNKLSRLLDIYIEGSISKDEYDSKRELLNAEKQELQEKLQSFNTDTEEVYVTLELLLTLVSKAKSLYQSSRIDIKRQIIKVVFSNLFINGSKLGYAIKKPLEEFFKKATCLEWWKSSDGMRKFIDDYRYEILRLRPIINCIMDTSPQFQNYTSTVRTDNTKTRNTATCGWYSG